MANALAALLITYALYNTSTMRVFYLTSSAQIGGGNRSLLTLWGGLRIEDVSPVAVSPADGPMVAACRETAIPCTVMEYRQPSWRRPLRNARTCRQWGRLIRECQAELVHANDMAGARSICLAARLARLPLVCHVRYPSSREYVNWVFRRLPKPDAFIFNSRALYGQMSPAVEEGCPRSRQVVVHNAVDTSMFHTASTDRNGPLRVGILANLLHVKGHLDFLEMARILLERNDGLEFWIIGEDIHGTGYGETVRKRARELKLAPRVQFWGHRNDVPELLRQLQVVVCCSHVEPFGRCLIEAMSCKVPTVATKVGGIPEVVEDEVSGLLVPPRSPDKLAAAVTRLLNDPALRERMGQAGRERVERLFSVERHVEQIIAVYDSVLSRPNREGDARLGT